MLLFTRWMLSLLTAVTLLSVPLAYYRCQHTQNKRLRAVAPGVLYRSGNLRAAGLEQAIQRFGIRTVINFWDRYPDPALDSGERESELCKRHGVRHLYIPVDLLPPPELTERRPEAIARFLAVMDDPANHPVLIHCHAGVHRTGIHSAIYRMEYESWPRSRAMKELKETGFGDSACNDQNQYVNQYVLLYQPRAVANKAKVAAGVRDRISEQPEP